MNCRLPERYMNFLSERAPKKSDERYTVWEQDRNVIDAYKKLSNEEIRDKVSENRLPYAILMTHLNIDYNLGAILRVGNCLGAQVFYYGAKKWDKRGAQGAWYYSPITHLKSIEEVRALKEQYSFVALEQTKTSVCLPQFKWPKKPLIVLGEESCGLQGCPEIFELAEHFVEIPQFGSIRSMNAATAGAIAAYDYMSKLLY
jgi:tRNA G18 (ribose-2'-O)-methylase SpoU